jgi:hypothetical protein
VNLIIQSPGMKNKWEGRSSLAKINWCLRLIYNSWNVDKLRLRTVLVLARTRAFIKKLDSSRIARVATIENSQSQLVFPKGKTARRPGLETKYPKYSRPPSPHLRQHFFSILVSTMPPMSLHFILDPYNYLYI